MHNDLIVHSPVRSRNLESIGRWEGQANAALAHTATYLKQQRRKKKAAARGEGTLRIAGEDTLALANTSTTRDHLEEVEVEQQQRLDASRTKRWQRRKSSLILFGGDAGAATRQTLMERNKGGTVKGMMIKNKAKPGRVKGLPKELGGTQISEVGPSRLFRMQARAQKRQQQKLAAQRANFAGTAEVRPGQADDGTPPLPPLPPLPGHSPTGKKWRGQSSPSHGTGDAGNDVPHEIPDQVSRFRTTLAGSASATMVKRVLDPAYDALRLGKTSKKQDPLAVVPQDDSSDPAVYSAIVGLAGHGAAPDGGVDGDLSPRSSMLLTVTEHGVWDGTTAQGLKAEVSWIEQARLSLASPLSLASSLAEARKRSRRNRQAGR